MMNKIFFLPISILFILAACTSQEKKDVQLLNQIILKNELQIPYIREQFSDLTESKIDWTNFENYFSREEIRSFLNKEKETDKQFRIQQGDLKYQDRLLRKEKESIVFVQETDSCNKVIFTFSRPMISHDGQTLLLILSNRYTKCNNNVSENTLNGTDALIFQRKADEWQLKQEIDLSYIPSAR